MPEISTHITPILFGCIAILVALKSRVLSHIRNQLLLAGSITCDLLSLCSIWQLKNWILVLALQTGGWCLLLIHHSKITSRLRCPNRFASTLLHCTLGLYVLAVAFSSVLIAYCLCDSPIIKDVSETLAWAEILLGTGLSLNVLYFVSRSDEDEQADENT